SAPSSAGLSSSWIPIVDPPSGGLFGSGGSGGSIASSSSTGPLAAPALHPPIGPESRGFFSPSFEPGTTTSSSPNAAGGPPSIFVGTAPLGSSTGNVPRGVPPVAFDGGPFPPGFGIVPLPPIGVVGPCDVDSPDVDMRGGGPHVGENLALASPAVCLSPPLVTPISRLRSISACSAAHRPSARDRSPYGKSAIVRSASVTGPPNFSSSSSPPTWDRVRYLEEQLRVAEHQL
ncbi:unnamed protein product, partial [Amoebophrya sp. A25]